MRFESSNFLISRNGKVQDKKHLKILSKDFAENGKEKLFPNNYSLLINLKMQNKHYPDNLNLVSFCRRTSLHALVFPISLLKRNLRSY